MKMLHGTNLSCPVAVDTMLNAANIWYGAVPLRLYVIQDETVVYEGGPGPVKYEIAEVDQWFVDNSLHSSTGPRIQG